jgi:hypothetical protein
MVTIRTSAATSARISVINAANLDMTATNVLTTAGATTY